MRRCAWWVVAVVALAGAGSGCSSDDGGDATATSTTSRPASTEVATSARKPLPTASVLGVLNAAGGSFDGSTLTLTGVQPSGTWFSDRPIRMAGTSDVEAFNDLFFTRDDPPNAAVEIVGADDDGDLAIVELSDPSYDAEAAELTFKASIIDEDTVDSAQVVAHPNLLDYYDRNDGGLPETFGASALFIDAAAKPITPVVQTTPDAQDVADLAATVAQTQQGYEQLIAEQLDYIEKNVNSACWVTMETHTTRVYHLLLDTAVPSVQQMQQEVEDNDGIFPATDADQYTSSLANVQNLQLALENAQQITFDYCPRHPDSKPT